MFFLLLLTLCFASSKPSTPYHTLNKSGDYYYLDIGVGTPPQMQQVILDTDSVDLSVFSNNTGAPTMFNNHTSSTSKYLSSEYFNQFAGYWYTFEFGDYLSDIVTLNDTSVRVQFGYQTYGIQYFGLPGVFGLGQRNSEYGLDYHDYDSYPYALRNQGKTNTAAYSVSLATNELLFGAVDLNRFTGKLQKLPFQSRYTHLVEFEVAGHKLNGTLHGGTAVTYLPDDAYNAAAQSIGMTYDNKVRNYVTKNLSTSLTLHFGDVPITIGPDLLLTVKNGVGYFNIETVQTGLDARLGDLFMRSAYVVYDLENRQLAVGQSSFNTGGSNFVNITKDEIPGTNI